MFSKQELKKLATPASFSRGQAYFEEGAVGRIRHRPEDNFYSAIVSGSADYGVELNLAEDDNDPDFFCDCPYDYEGICKHAVALGLAVLEKVAAEAPYVAADAKPTLKKAPAQKATARTAPPAGSAAPPVVSASELEAALRDVPKAEQLKFLALHLRQNPALARAFITRFVGPPLPPDPLDADPTLPRLDELRDDLRRALSKLRFDYNTLANDRGEAPRTAFRIGAPGRFLPDMEQRLAAVLHPVLRPVAEAIRAALAAGRLAEALRRWHGAWLGIMSVQKPAADSYNLFFSNYYPRHVAEVWLALLTETGVKKLLSEQEFAAAEVTRCLPVFVRAVIEPLRPDSAAKGAAAPPANLPDADLALLLAAAPNPSLAPALRDALKPFPHRLLPEVQMRLAAGCRDWLTWEPLAKQQAYSDEAVMLSLLHFYLERPNRRIDLREAAAMYIVRYPAAVGPFVLEHLTPDENRPLYVKALTQRLESQQHFDDFEALTGFWTSKERTAFVQQMLSKRLAQFRPLFRARVLVFENRPAEILPLIMKLDWHPRVRPSWWVAPPPEEATDLPDLLQLAARHDPEATLDAAMERTEQLLADKPRRSVELYERIASWLRALHEMPALTAQVTLFAEGLYGLHNKLTHLRRALREAELLPEPEPVSPKPPRPGRPGPPKPSRKPKNPFGR